MRRGWTERLRMAEEWRLLRPSLRLSGLLRRSLFAAIEHDFLTVAQAAAYSAIVALFPALIVSAAVVALLPGSAPFRLQMALFFDRILPSDVLPVLGTYFAGNRGAQTARALVSAAVVSLTGASSVMATLMEGFRRAHELPLQPGMFWQRRMRALALVPLSLLPMTAASGLVVFGQWITASLAGAAAPELQRAVYLLTLGLRWTLALTGSVGILAVIYHLGTDSREHLRQQLLEPLGPLVRKPWNELRRYYRSEWSWRRSLPGATVATALWFPSTLLFGLYVTRFANYRQVYGSLGAAIALLIWLYLIALSVLMGAEFNAQLAAERRDTLQRTEGEAAEFATGREAVSRAPVLRG